MNHSFIYLDFPDHEYKRLISASLSYALLSAPFTVDRLALLQKKDPHLATEQRVYNIFKGKLAEALFEYFCHINGLKIDFDSPKTPYYQVDNRDFCYKNIEFDIKNNFIYHEEEFFIDYSKLPALIPNRFKNDQWDTRLKPKIKSEVAYVFSFMKAAELKNNKRGKPFIQLLLTKQQTQIIHEYFLKYKGLPQRNAVFDKEQYLNSILKSNKLSSLYCIHFLPKLVIAGYASKNNWDLFKNTSPLDVSNHYQNEPFENWYQKVGAKKTISFLSGTIWGTITNKTLPVQNLYPITSLFPELKKRVVGGKWF